MQTMEVIRIDKVYTGDESDGMTFTYDPQTCTDHLQGNEYDPSLRNEPTRPIKPLHVTQLVLEYNNPRSKKGKTKQFILGQKDRPLK